jgi:hypothetical protein
MPAAKISRTRSWPCAAATTERGDEIVLTMLERGCRAIRELGTIDLVRQLSTPPSSKSTPGL